MTLDQQLAVWGHDRRLVAWLIVTGRVRPTADYLVASKLRVGKVAAGIYREFHGRFLQVAAGLGFDPKSAELQWWAVAKVAALAGVSPERLTKAQLDYRSRAADRRDPPAASRPSDASAADNDEVARRGGDVVSRRRDRRRRRANATRTSPQFARSEWAAVPPRLRRRSQGYIEQMRLSLRPATMVRVEAVLREFASWLTTHAPEVAAVSRSAPRAHRALQTSPRRAACAARRATVEHRAGGAARHAAGVPRAPQRMARRGRSRRAC